MAGGKYSGGSVGPTVEMGELNLPANTSMNVNDDGDAEGIALGAVGTVFTSNGETVSPSYQAASGGALTKLGTVTVTGAATQAMVLSGLSVGLNKPMRLYWSIKNATGASIEPRLYVNGEMTDTKYQVSYYSIEDTADLAKAVRHYPQFGHVNPNEASTGFIDMSISEDGFFQYATSTLRFVGTGATKHIMQWFQGSEDTTVLTSLTAVRLDGMSASILDINSTFTLWEYTV